MSRIPRLTGIISGLMLYAAILSLSGCAPSPAYKDSREAHSNTEPASPDHENVQMGDVLTGFASYYGPGFAGRPTATGETFDPRKFTAAHRTLPFGTMLKVTLVSSGRSVVVRVNDRGPYAKDRILDLSERAAEKIGLKDVGVGYIQAEILSVGDE